MGGGGSMFRMNGLRTKEIFARVVNGCLGIGRRAGARGPGTPLGGEGRVRQADLGVTAWRWLAAA